MSLGKSVSLSMSTAKMISSLMNWCDESIEEMNESGPGLKKKYIPQLDLVPLLACDESMIEQELAFQLGPGFPFPDEKFIAALKQSLNDIRIDSPKLAASATGSIQLSKCPKRFTA